MAKNLLINFIILLLLFLSQTCFAENSTNNKSMNQSSYDNKIKIIASPNWVHPKQRQSNAGYSKLIEQKKDSTMWKYTTNRPSGNIVGGGTTKYNDYKPLYLPGKKGSN